MEDLFEDKRKELVNQLIELLQGCNPIETLGQLTFKMKLAMFFKRMGNELMITNEEDQSDLAGFDNDTMFKKISYIQRVLFSGKIAFGTKPICEKDVLEVVDKLTFNHMGQEFLEESSLIHANRYIVTHNIHSHLIVEYTKHLNSYFFEEDDLKEINDFVMELYMRETSLQMEEMMNTSVEEYFEIKKNYSFLSVFDTESIDELNLNTRYFNSVVKYEDKYYVFQPNITFDNYYETMRRIYLLKNKNNHSKFNELQQKMSEELSVQFFSKLLPHSTAYTNINYRANTGTQNARNTCEIDFLLETGDTLFLGEVKGARLFPGDFNENQSAYDNNVEELLEKPYKQAKRFYDELKSNEIIETTEKIFSFSDYKTFVIVNITTDYLDEVAVQHSNALTTNDYFVWNLSLADLHQYTYLFDHQADFLNFINQRKKLIESYSHLNYQDEFIFYGFYAEYNDMSITFAKNPALLNNNILFALDGFLEPSNIYISEKVAFGYDVQLPQYEKKSEQLKQLIECTRDKEDIETINMVRYLLELSSDAEQKFFKTIDLKWNRICRNTTYRKIAEGPVFISYYEPNENPIVFTLYTIKAIPCKLPVDLDKRLSIRFGTLSMINLIQLSSKKEIIDCKCFILSYGEKKHEKAMYEKERQAYLEKTGYELERGIEDLKSNKTEV